MCVCVCRKEERKAGGYESESLFPFPIVGKVNRGKRKEGRDDGPQLPTLIETATNRALQSL